MKKLLLWMMPLIAVMLFTACHNNVEDHIGIYECIDIDVMGIDMGNTRLYPDGVFLTLGEAGEAALDIDGHHISTPWQLSGSKLILSDLNGVSYSGSLKDNIIIIEIADMNMTFKKTE